MLACTVIYYDVAVCLSCQRGSILRWSLNLYFSKICITIIPYSAMSNDTVGMAL